MFPSGYNSRSVNCCSGAAAGYVFGSSQLLVPGRVAAAEEVPQGATSGPIEAGRIVGHPDVQQLSVRLDPSRKISLTEKSHNAWNQNFHWVRVVRIAEDCHSYNVLLKLYPTYQRINSNLTTSTPELVLEATKRIEVGQELLMWFSEDILAMLQVAFLTPFNIQSQKRYVCHRCSAMYESPNPLKLHLMLGCGKSSISLLWQKLADTLRDNSHKSLQAPKGFDFKLSPEPQIVRQKIAIDLSLPTVTRSLSEDLYRPYKETSAFKPFKKEENLSPVPVHPASFDQDVHFAPTYTDEAQIETLVSSLGKSGQGHVCLYCGKCYSRKYGLKIHIRTHTGYKPLKCKFCSRPFGDPSNLNKHVRLHAEGDTPYKCDLCGKVLVRRRDLKRHLKSRHMVEMHPDIDILDQSESPIVEVAIVDDGK